MPAYSLGGTSAWALTSHSDQTVTGAKTFQAGTATAVPLRVTGISGHTGNLLDFIDGGGTLRSSFNSVGRLLLGNGGTHTPAWLSISTTGDIGITVKAAGGQVNDLTQWQNNAGSVVARVYNSGSIESVGGLIQSTSPNGGRTRLTYTTSTGSDGVAYDYGVIYTFNDTNPGTAARPLLGRIIAQGKDSAGNATNFTDLRSQISDVTDASEDGFMILYTLEAGTTRETARWGDTNAGYHSRFLNYHPSAVTLRAQSMAAGATGSLIDAVNSAGNIIFSVNQAGIAKGGDTGWTIIGNTGAPAFETGWVHYYSATQEPLGYRKLVDGTVKLKGLTKNAAAQAAGSIIYTLPAGYRPAHYMRFAVTSHTGTNGGFGRVDVGQNGAVYYITGNVAEMDLSSISFLAEN